MEQQNKENIQNIVENVVPVVQQPKQNKTLVVILSLLLLISMSVSGYFAYQTQTLVKELILLKSSPTPVSSIEPTLDTTADWKIYVNNDFDFSFYYPKDYKLVNDGWEKIGDNPKGHYVVNMDNPSSDFSINIDIRNSSSRLGGNYKEITVADTVAYEDLDSVGKYVFFEKDGYSYDVQVLSLDSNKTNTEANLVFDRILSTFKFINTTVQTEEKVVQEFVGLFSKTYVGNDWLRLKTLLTVDAAKQMSESMTVLRKEAFFDSFNILSVKKDNSTGNYVAEVEFIKDGKPYKTPAGNPKIVVTKQSNEWRSMTWYLYQ